jgi:hypothetical protein
MRAVEGRRLKEAHHRFPHFGGAVMRYTFHVSGIDQMQK